MKRQLYQGILGILLSVIILVPLIRPFLTTGRLWTYDVDIHQYRMAAFHAAVAAGQIPPRWSSQLVYGYGSPVFTFNWSLSYWMAEPFLFAGWTTTDATKAVIILSVVLSYIVMYFFLSGWWGFWPALTGSMIYEWALFRIYLLYTGGGLGMETAFIFWPMLFWALNIRKKHSVWLFVLIVIGTAGTMLSHQVMFLMIQPLFWAVTGYIAWKEYSMKHLIPLIWAFITGLGLTAYFWLPAFAEQGFVHIGITKNVVWDNFLSVATVLYQPGITERVPTNIFWYWATGWNLFVIAVTSMIFLVRKRFDGMVALYAAFFWIGQVIMLSVSAWFWRVFPLLSDFQYPVRFQSLSLFCAAVLTAFILSRLKEYAALLCIAMIALTIGLHLLAFPTWPIKYIPDSVYNSGDSTADMMGEYIPSWGNINYFTEYTGHARQPPVRIIDGSGIITKAVKGVSSVAFTLTATSPVTVIVNQMYFPGWVARDNGRMIPISSYGEGEMKADISKGEHTVVFAFGDTPVRIFGNVITEITFGLMVLYGVTLWERKRRAISGS